MRYCDQVNGMRAVAFWKAVTLDRSNFLEALIGLLEENGIRYCVIGGQGVNAYVDPLVSLGLDLVVAVDQLQEAETILGAQFGLERSPHSLNVSAPDSNRGDLSRFAHHHPRRDSPFARLSELRALRTLS